MALLKTEIGGHHVLDLPGSEGYEFGARGTLGIPGETKLWLLATV